MKTLIAVVVAAFALAGCVAVPAYPEPAYSYSPGYYYPAPAASFSFGYNYYDGPRHHHYYRRGR